VAAIDFGRIRVGLALSDELGMLAHPRPALDGRSRKRLLKTLVQLTQQEGICRFLVGLPLDMHGGAGVAANRVVRFCRQLADATGVEVELVDERLTSVQAERELASSGAGRQRIADKVDGVAAAIILQQWLDGHRDP